MYATLAPCHAGALTTRLTARRGAYATPYCSRPIPTFYRGGCTLSRLASARSGSQLPASLRRQSHRKESASSVRGKLVVKATAATRSEPASVNLGTPQPFRLLLVPAAALAVLSHVIDGKGVLLASYWCARYFLPAAISLWVAKHARKRWDSVSASAVLAATYVLSMGATLQLWAGPTSTLRLHYPLFSGLVTIPASVGRWVMHSQATSAVLTRMLAWGPWVLLTLAAALQLAVWVDPAARTRAKMAGPASHASHAPEDATSHSTQEQPLEAQHQSSASAAVQDPPTEAQSHDTAPLPAVDSEQLSFPDEAQIEENIAAVKRDGLAAFIARAPRKLCEGAQDMAKLLALHLERFGTEPRNDPAATASVYHIRKLTKKTHEEVRETMQSRGAGSPFLQVAAAICSEVQAFVGHSGTGLSLDKAPLLHSKTVDEVKEWERRAKDDTFFVNENVCLTSARKALDTLGHQLALCNASDETVNTKPGLSWHKILPEPDFENMAWRIASPNEAGACFHRVKMLRGLLAGALDSITGQRYETVAEVDPDGIETLSQLLEEASMKAALDIRSEIEEANNEETLCELDMANKKLQALTEEVSMYQEGQADLEAAVAQHASAEESLQAEVDRMQAVLADKPLGFAHEAAEALGIDLEATQAKLAREDTLELLSAAKRVHDQTLEQLRTAQKEHEQTLKQLNAAQKDLGALQAEVDRLQAVLADKPQGTAMEAAQAKQVHEQTLEQLSAAQVELGALQAEVDSVQAVLADKPQGTAMEAAQAKQVHEQTLEQLSAAKKELGGTQSQMNYRLKELDRIKQVHEQTLEQLSAAQNELGVSQNQLNYSVKELDRAKELLEQLQTGLNSLMKLHGVSDISGRLMNRPQDTDAQLGHLGAWMARHSRHSDMLKKVYLIKKEQDKRNAALTARVKELISSNEERDIILKQFENLLSERNAASPVAAVSEAPQVIRAETKDQVNMPIKAGSKNQHDTPIKTDSNNQDEWGRELQAVFQQGPLVTKPLRDLPPDSEPRDTTQKATVTATTPAQTSTTDNAKSSAAAAIGTDAGVKAKTASPAVATATSNPPAAATGKTADAAAAAPAVTVIPVPASFDESFAAAAMTAADVSAKAVSAAAKEAAGRDDSFDVEVLVELPSDNTDVRQGSSPASGGVTASDTSSKSDRLPLSVVITGSDDENDSQGEFGDSDDSDVELGFDIDVDFDSDSDEDYDRLLRPSSRIPDRRARRQNWVM